MLCGTNVYKQYKRVRNSESKVEIRTHRMPCDCSASKDLLIIDNLTKCQLEAVFSQLSYALWPPTMAPHGPRTLKTRMRWESDSTNSHALGIAVL
mmetsp:Transcript_1597/g.2430  ORF Transcript_1597/g.2430 Transcript_1597/m.2430 type:complete len:95 (-) Transcript_1597:3756-4040(-)